MTPQALFWQRFSHCKLRFSESSSAQSVHCLSIKEGERHYTAEATIDGFVEALRDVFTEARRVLKPTGMLFLNIGDTYYSAKGKPHGRDVKATGRQMARTTLRAVDGAGLGLPRKFLIGIPWRVALAMQQDGWTLRSDIIWNRPGSLGEPTAKNRPWRDFEHIFMFSRAPRYFFDRTGLDGNEDIWSFPARPDKPDDARGARLRSDVLREGRF